MWFFGRQRSNNCNAILVVIGLILLLLSGSKVTAFAAASKRPSSGGFGGAKAAAAASQRSNKKSTTGSGKNKRTKADALDLNSAEGRMAYIRSRIESADVSSMSKLSLQTDPRTNQVFLDIDPNNICVVDNFLGEELIQAMRQEAESLLPEMIPSQSTRWDETQQKVVSYDKKGVLSTQIQGGSVEGYTKSPRLIEYIVTLTTGISKALNDILPETHHLSGKEQTNKLAVCLGQGSAYDKHIDNMGGADLRKLTALLYLQPPGSHDSQPDFPHECAEDDSRGGYFRAFDVPQEDAMTCIAPRGDRLILFWSDSLVHDVSPSFTPNGEKDRRWALTTWLVIDPNGGKIRATDVRVQQKHFG